jgi:hypothetical protein
MKSMTRKLETEFTFAGFNFPKWQWSLPRGPLPKRVQEAKRCCTSGYYGSPTPNNTDGIGFYLSDSGGNPFQLRWKWCDDIATRIHHTGWYCDDYQDAKIRGLVLALPHGRGWLAGWSMGEGMASEVSYHVYDEEMSAAYAADSMAEHAADREREYQAKEEEKREAEEDAHEAAKAQFWAERDVMTDD